MQILKDVVAQNIVDMLKIFSPRQLKYVFVLHAQSMRFVQMLCHLRHSQ